jgi:hypothetical protein
MNYLVFLAVFAVVVISVLGQPLSKGGASPVAEKPAPPAYISESSLPRGWPSPGPFNEVTEKHYPASRIATTVGSSPNFSFWTLFKHIRRNGIPMTSPVEMAMKDEPNGGMKMQRMGFLYQSKEVGKAGADGEDVIVRDLPPRVVISYTWQGPRDEKSLSKARAAITAVLVARNLRSSEYRLFGYNSPSVPKKKQTYELQAVIK